MHFLELSFICIYDINSLKYFENIWFTHFYTLTRKMLNTVRFFIYKNNLVNFNELVKWGPYMLTMVLKKNCSLTHHFFFCFAAMFVKLCPIKPIIPFHHYNSSVSNPHNTDEPVTKFFTFRVCKISQRIIFNVVLTACILRNSDWIHCLYITSANNFKHFSVYIRTIELPNKFCQKLILSPLFLCKKK